MVMLDVIIRAYLNKLILRPEGTDLHDALYGAVHRPVHQTVQRLGGVTQHTPQHGHVHASHDTDANPIGHTQGHVARRCPEDIAQHQGLFLANSVAQPALDLLRAV